jgi:hypothetical protein
MIMKNLSLIMMAALICFSMAAAQEDITKHPGYVDLSGIQIPNGTGEVTEVTLGPEIFGMIGHWTGDKADSENPFGKGGLLSINVKTFEIDSEITDNIQEEMAKIEKKLQKENWTPIVRVKSGEERTNVSIKFDKGNQKTLGLLIMSVEPGHEASFVNIVGTVPLEALSNMGVDMDDSAMDSLKQVLEKPSKKPKEVKEKQD